MFHLTRKLRVFPVLLFTLLCGSHLVLADSGTPQEVTATVGRTFKFTFVPNEEGDNQYSFIQEPNGAAALTSVSPDQPFTTDGDGVWTIKCLASGTARIYFTWENPDHGDSDEFECVVTIQAAGQTTGNGTQIAVGGDPVNTRTGELFGVENVDLNLRGPLPLYFERYYASRITSDHSLSSALGANRSHNFDMTLLTDGSTQATVTTSRGRTVMFNGIPGGKWSLSLPLDIAYQLLKTAGGYLFADPATQLQYLFNASGQLTSIQDGRGNALTLSYTSGQLSSVSDGLGRTLTFTYSSGHLMNVSDGARIVGFTYSGNNLATAADASGNTTTYAYDSNNFLLSGTRPIGNVPISQLYTSGTVTTQTQRAANTTFVYVTGTTTETDPSGAHTTYRYSPDGTLAFITDAVGNTIFLSDDSSGHWNSVTDRLGRTSTVQFQPQSGLVSAVTRPDGASTVTAYKARVTPDGLTFYDRSKITFPDATAQTFTYDANGSLLLFTDALGKKTKYTRNSRGRPLTIINPLGGVTTYTYNAAGLVASVQDSDTQPTSFAYNSFGRVIKITHPDNTTRGYSYNSVDLLVSATDELDGTTAYAYDTNNRPTTITDAAGHSFFSAYDSSDTPVSFTDRNGRTAFRTYDSRGLVVSGTDPLGNATKLAYNSLRRLTAVTDPTNVSTAFGYDAETHLISVTDSLDHKTAFSRDLLGLLSAATDPLGHTASVQHDLLLRPTLFTDPVGRQTRRVYDKAGRLVAAARDGMAPGLYTRDALGDVTQVKDPNGGTWKYGYTPMGRLTAATDPLGRKTVYAYDSRGRLSTVTNPDGVTVTITRNGASLVTGLAGSDGATLGFSYDPDHRLTAATSGTASNDIAFTLDNEGNITRDTQNGINWDAAYDHDEHLSSVAYNNGLFTVNYTYDGAGRITGVSDTLSSGTVGFAYDAAGRASAVTRSNGVNTAFTLDAADRLTRIQHGSIIDLKYTLDAAGAVTACSAIAPLLPAVQAVGKTFKLDKAAQIVSAAGSETSPATGNYSYDARGRITTSATYDFGWDAFSRLRTIADPTAGLSANDRSFTYDALGATVTRAVGPAASPAARTRYFHHHAIAGAPIVAEYDDLALAFIRYYVFTPGGQLLYSIDAGAGAAVRYYHTDLNGSVLALSDTSGAVTDSYAYGPYGESLIRSGSSSQPFRWLGASSIRTDLIGPPASENSASVFYDIRARWLDPATARFLSRDPSGPALTDVRTLDPYQYAFGDPATFIDTTGKAGKSAQAARRGSIYDATNRAYKELSAAALFFGHIFERAKDEAFLEFEITIERPSQAAGTDDTSPPVADEPGENPDNPPIADEPPAQEQTENPPDPNEMPPDEGPAAGAEGSTVDSTSDTSLSYLDGVTVSENPPNASAGGAGSPPPGGSPSPDSNPYAPLPGDAGADVLTINGGVNGVGYTPK